MLSVRASGILLHPTSLPNRFPIGDLGPAAFAFVDFLADSGQRWWQMLPIGPAGDGDSPYQALSAFAGNPLLISPESLLEERWLRESDLRGTCSEREVPVDYPAAASLKKRWLTIAFERFEQEGTHRPGFDDFVRAESAWLDDFALFSALSESAGTSDWTQWEKPLRSRDASALAAAKATFAHAIRFHEFVQWQFDTQWKKLHAYSREKNVHLLGDVPIFVAHASADVWAHQDLFKLKADGKPTVVAGVPPDYFSKTGQLWNLPVYRWDVLEASHFGWWIDRLATAFARFEALRLDHFIGFTRTYEIPAEAPTAMEGRYRPGPGQTFFNAVRRRLGAVQLIAEDLGVVTPAVDALRDQFQLPGMHVLQFAFSPGKEVEAARPEQYAELSVVYTGTHDNDTTVGWFRKLHREQRLAILKALGTTPREIHWALMRVAFASKASTAIVPAQDLLGLGSSARMNIPSTPTNNWRWRLKAHELSPELAQKLRRLAKICGR